MVFGSRNIKSQFTFASNGHIIHLKYGIKLFDSPPVALRYPLLIPQTSQNLENIAPRCLLTFLPTRYFALSTFCTM